MESHLAEVNVIAPGLESQGGPFTIFAPTDEAFQSLNPDLVRAIAGEH